MADQSERSARLLARALYRATDGGPRWWVLPTNLNDMTKEAIAVAVARGWMLDRGDSVHLTDAGRDLVEEGRCGAIGVARSHGDLTLHPVTARALWRQQDLELTVTELQIAPSTTRLIMKASSAASGGTPQMFARS